MWPTKPTIQPFTQQWFADLSSRSRQDDLLRTTWLRIKLVKISLIKTALRISTVKQYKLGGLNRRNLFSHQFWRLECNIKVSAGLIISEICEERVCYNALSLAFMTVFSLYLFTLSSLPLYISVLKFPISHQSSWLKDPL